MPEQLSSLCAIDGDIYKQIITFVTIVIGWVVVHLLSSNREMKKDKRSLIESVRSTILDLEKKGVSYHTSSITDIEQVEEDIISCLDMVSSRVSHIEESFSSEEIMALRKSITLTNFQTSKKTRTEYKPNSEFVLEIRAATKDLCDKLDAKFYSLY